MNRVQPLSFQLWLTTSLIIMVTALTYLLFPAVRERFHERMAILFPSKPGPTENTVAPQEPAVSHALSSAPPSTLAPPDAGIRKPFFRPQPSEKAPVVIKEVAPPAEEARATAEPPPTPRSEPTPARAPRRGGPPVLQREGRAAQPESRAEVPAANAPKAEPAADKTPPANADEAYKILMDKVPKMAAAANKTDPVLRQKSWSAVRAEGPEVWIDLVTVRTTDGQEEHFIWKVHTTDLTVQPLSQSARRIMTQ